MWIHWSRNVSTRSAKVRKQNAYTNHKNRYWDWTLDVLKLVESPVMSSTTGFGGDGSTTRLEDYPDNPPFRCVDDGPFSNLRPSYRAINGRYYELREHCLDRDISDIPERADLYNATYVGTVQSIDNYNDYRVDLESGPHQAIHSTLRGEMNPSTSPNGKCIARNQVGKATSLTRSQSLSSSCTIRRLIVCGGNGRK